MPRLNLYEQQTTAQGPRASGAEFGAAPAQAMEGAGNELQVIGNRIQERENLSDRQRLRESFEEFAVPALDGFDKNPEISGKESIPRFRQALEQKRQELIGKHAGNPESRAKLENQLDNLVSQYTKSAIGAKINADQQLMIRTMNQQFEKSALDTDAAPDIWSFAKDENLMLVEDMRPGMSQDQYVAAKRLAYAKPLQAAVKSHIAQGNYEAAGAIIKDENFSKFLTAQEAIPLRIDVAVGRGKVQKEEREIEGDRKAMSSILGYDVPKENVVPGFAKMPSVQKMQVWQMMNPGKEMPDDMKLRALNLEKQSAQDKSMRVAENLQNWNDLTPQDKMWTRLELIAKFPPVRIVNPLDNSVTYAPNPSAGYLELNAMGFNPTSNARPLTGSPVVRGSETQVDSATQASRDTEARGMIESELAQANQRLTDATTKGDAAGITRAKGDVESLTRELGRMGSAAPTNGAPSGEDSDLIDLYDNADKLVGVKSGLLRFGEGLPLGVGEAVGEKTKGVYEKSTRAALRLQNDIVDGLRGADEKIANQYREELKKIVTIDPQIINSEYKLRTTFKTLDKELRKKQKDYQKIVDGKVPAGPDEKRGAAYAINAINSVLSRMNVPQKTIYTNEEYEKLSPHERYLWADDPTPKYKGGKPRGGK
jgi:hypothetical protein